jgi:hypothetical protein
MATPEEAKTVVEWAIKSGKVPTKDLEAARLNKTGCLCIEEDGKPILFVPFYALIQVAYLAFNPESRASERFGALEKALEGMSDFANKNGIREIQTLSLRDYPVAKWAVKNGFVEEDRNAFVFKVPK